VPATDAPLASDAASPVAAIASDAVSPDATPTAAPSALQAPPPAVASAGPDDAQVSAEARAADARLARVHLRGGLLPLARAALEQMAGAGTLDRDAMADLAEVRWRNGDLEGAVESARAHHASGGNEPVAMLIVAEELSRRGEQQQASQQASSVVQRVGAAVELYFAGEPRSVVWPAADDGWMDVDAVAPGRWGLLVGGREVVAPTPRTWIPVPLEQPGSPAPAASPAAMDATLVGRGGIAQPGGQTSTALVAMSGRLAGEELEAVDRSLADGRTGAAAERLGVLLRLDPALAPVILTAADKAVANTPPGSPGQSAIHLVRGDAYRILGHETEAAAAFQQAHQTLAPGSPSEEPH